MSTTETSTSAPTDRSIGRPVPPPLTDGRPGVPLARLVEAGGFTHLSFAGHFDSLMFGRRGIKKVDRERDLHPHRVRFVERIGGVRRPGGRNRGA